MMQLLHIFRFQYLAIIGISIIFSYGIVKKPIVIFFTLIPFITGLVFYKNIKTLLILEILYILIFFDLTIIIIADYLHLEPVRLVPIIYSPLLICITTGFVAYLLKNGDFFIKYILRHYKFLRIIVFQLMILILLMMVNYIKIRLSGGHAIIGHYIVNFFLPFTFFIATVTAVIKNDLTNEDIQRIIRIFLFITFFIACFGFYEAVVQQNFIYKNMHSRFFIEHPYFVQSLQRPYRIYTTIGHPLRNSVVFSIAALLALTMKRMKYIFLTVFVVANVLTYTRSMVIILPFIFLLYGLIRFNVSMWKRVVFILLFLLIGTGIYMSPLSKGMEYRIKTDKTSSLIRFNALNYMKTYILPNVQYLLFGSGTVSRAISSQYMGINAYFEIPWVIMMIENGFLVTFFYIVVLLQIVYILYKNIKGHGDLSLILFLAVVGSALQLSTFSGLIFFNSMSLLYWIMISLGVGLAYIKSDETNEENVKKMN